jgi:hypothetical protein
MVILFVKLALSTSSHHLKMTIAKTAVYEPLYAYNPLLPGFNYGMVHYVQT